MRTILIILALLLATPCFAETIYVRANADLAEIVPPAPFVVTAEIKAKLNNEAPIHPILGVKYITRHIAKLILKCSGTEAQQVIDALVADGIIKTAAERYAEQYPSEVEP